ncbi:MAG: SPOR domain-containing protein [Polaromonas sp.]
MLRLIVLALILANAGYFAYSQGLLAAYGYAPATQAEPQRLTQQIKPEALRILNPQEASQLENATPPVQAAVNATATECLQVGIFNEEQTMVLRDKLVSSLPPNSWVIESALVPARWLVYMGKYNSDEAVVKKKSELRGLGVSFEALNNPSLEPGLSLGNFKTQPEAEAELARIAKKGVKTAKVMQERAEQRGQRLKLPAVDAALRGQLDVIKPQLAGKAFAMCS